MVHKATPKERKNKEKALCAKLLGSPINELIIDEKMMREEKAKQPK